MGSVGGRGLRFLTGVRPGLADKVTQRTYWKPQGQACE